MRKTTSNDETYNNHQADPFTGTGLSNYGLVAPKEAKGHNRLKVPTIAASVALVSMNPGGLSLGENFHGDLNQYKKIEAPASESASKSLSEKIQEKRPFKKVVFEYPAYISSIDEKDSHNNPKAVTIAVSVDGKYKYLKRSVKNIGFEVKPNMDLLAQGIEKRGNKKIKFIKPPEPELTEEEKEIIGAL